MVFFLLVSLRLFSAIYGLLTEVKFYVPGIRVYYTTFNAVSKKWYYKIFKNSYKPGKTNVLQKLSNQKPYNTLLLNT
jgi:hypothetical protein